MGPTGTDHDEVGHDVKQDHQVVGGREQPPRPCPARRTACSAHTCPFTIQFVHSVAAPADLSKRPFLLAAPGSSPGDAHARAHVVCGKCAQPKSVSVRELLRAETAGRACELNFT